jgi:hypothetical protein
MNHAIYPTFTRSRSSAGESWEVCETAARHRRLRALLALFGLYAVALLFVVSFADGADVGCVLFAIALHVLYAAHGLVASWRDASWLEGAKNRLRARPIAVSAGV